MNPYSVGTFSRRLAPWLTATAYNVPTLYGYRGMEYGLIRVYR